MTDRKHIIFFDCPDNGVPMHLVDDPEAAVPYVDVGTDAPGVGYSEDDIKDAESLAEAINDYIRKEITGEELGELGLLMVKMHNVWGITF